MAKYTKKSEKKKITAGKILLLVALAVLLAAIIWIVSILRQQQIPTLEESNTPLQSEVVLPEETTAGQPEEDPVVSLPIDLGEGLVIQHIGSYAGMYMEDGTNEPVTDVMMLILENTAEADLQLARIYMEYSTFTAEFEVTNLPAGEKVVLLEKNRHEATAENHQGIEVKNVIYFPEAMSLQEERIKIEGHDGTLEVTNISGADIPGDIYFYYKHSASDLLYGGITYRVALRGGLKAGQSNMVIAGHYTPDTCRLLLAESKD